MKIISQEKDDGYRGIWFELGQKENEYGDKYSGGLATYTAKHVPLAVYAPAVEKTFFVYGGRRRGDPRHLLAMVSYYDHELGVVPRPTIVHDKKGVDDPHDNPSVAIAADGHVWVFVSGRGRRRPGYRYRSTTPYSTDAFERIDEIEMTYPQPWYVRDEGFLLLFTKYTGVRELYWSTSADGRSWTPDSKLAGMGGHYQISCRAGRRVLTAFNMHPGGNVDVRTNLYFAETDDMGRTWRAADGTILDTPMTSADSAAAVHDYLSENRLVYVKDITVDSDGRPVVLVVTSASHRPGPAGDPRIWTIAHWTGTEWRFVEVTRSTHNYDMGSLYVEPDGRWRIIGPTEEGPQPHGTGGEMALWLSEDKGRSWRKVKSITSGSRTNHSYARRPAVAVSHVGSAGDRSRRLETPHPEFYAFWADGNPDELSESRLYFCDRDGACVRSFPARMDGKYAEPEAVREPTG